VKAGERLGSTSPLPFKGKAGFTEEGALIEEVN